MTSLSLSFLNTEIRLAAENLRRRSIVSTELVWGKEERRGNGLILVVFPP